MKFWDSSAIVPLLVGEKATRQLQQLATRDPDVLVWWGSEIECHSAVARLERAAAVSAKEAAAARGRLTRLAERWYEIEPSVSVRELAIRLLRVHPLRTADALQLAAALVASEHRPSSLGFVCLDERLAAAAQKEGFAVVELA